MSTKSNYLWRAWSEKRERICDCGIVVAASDAQAKAYAAMCLGGPHARAVVEIDVEIVEEVK